MTHPDLLSLLRTTKPRERSGSQTSARYAFQANYSILKLLDLREAGGDFRMIFDLFDDLLVLDSPTSPSQASFYQIKSKDPGEWSAADLCRATGKTKPRSIASRLYGHVDSFGIAVSETGFVTNAPFKMALADGVKTSASHHRIQALHLDADEQAKFSNAAAADFPDTNISGWLPKLVFLRASLGVHNQELVVMGRLQTHFERAGVEGRKVSAIYETLRASIMEKSAFSEEGLDINELLASKSLSRQEIDELLASAAARPRSPIENWEIIRADLASAGIGSVQQIRLHTAAIRYYGDKKLGIPGAENLAHSSKRWAATHAAEIDACKTLVEVAALIRSGLTSDDFGYYGTELAYLSA